MTLHEVQEKIAKSPLKKWFNETKEVFNLSYLEQRIEFIGVGQIYKFVDDQIIGWEKLEELPIELKNSKDYFKTIKLSLINFVNTYSEKENLSDQNLNSYWRVAKNAINNTSKFPMLYDSSEVDFLLTIFKNQPKSFNGAFKYIVNAIGTNFSNRDYFDGLILGYEFNLNGKVAIYKRTDSEKRALNNLKVDLQSYRASAENQLIDHLAKYIDQYKWYSKAIDDFKTDKEKLFSDWFKESSANFKSFNDNSIKQISDLEKTYDELLRLKKPADYWKQRAEELNREGWYATKCMIALICLAAISLYVLLVIAPGGMLKSFSTDTGAAIKWSVVYLMFVSICVYGIRVTHRIAFSSFHLARDAEEREQLMYVYLSLIKDNEISKEEKNLIIQSLFSRADTGLLKEDSSPTMPNDLIGKLINKA